MASMMKTVVQAILIFLIKVGNVTDIRNWKGIWIFDKDSNVYHEQVKVTTVIDSESAIGKLTLF